MFDIVSEYWGLLVGAQLHVIVGWALLWAVLCGIAGAVVGLVLFFVVRGRGWLATTWRFGRLVRVLVAVALTLTVALGGATLGGLEGALRATPDVIKESNFGEQGLTIIGHAVAAAYFTVHFVLLAYDPDTHELREDSPELQEAFAQTVPTLFVAFVDVAEEKGTFGEDAPADAPRLTQGAWAEVAARGLVMDFGVLRDNAGRFEESALRAAVEPVKAEVLPVFPKAIAERIDPAVEWVLVGGLRKVLYDKAAENLDKQIPGLSDILADYAGGLEDLAEQTGTPTDVTFEELSAYTIDALVMPLLMLPIRFVVRAQQMAIALIALLIAALVLAIIPVTNAILRWRARRSADSGENAPDHPGLDG